MNSWLDIQYYIAHGHSIWAVLNLRVSIPSERATSKLSENRELVSPEL